MDEENIVIEKPIGIIADAKNIKISHDNAFNFIRMVCCLLVIIFHSASYTNILSVFSHPKIGHICVCVFFILSGFWVTKSYLGANNLKEYFIKRIKKLLPMYYIAIFGVAVLSVFVTKLSPVEYFKSPDLYKYIFWNCIFLNFVHQGLPSVIKGKPINGALWTIKIEIGFYIILPLIILLIKKIQEKHEGRKSLNVFLLAIYILSIIYNIFLARYANVLHLPSQLSYQLPGFMSFFISGIIYLFNWEKFMKFKNQISIISFLFFIASFFTGTEILFPFALTSIVMFIGTTFGSIFKKVGNPIDYSYGMYLFHLPLVKIMNSFGFFSTHPIFTVFCVISLSFAISFILEKYFLSNK